MKSEADGRANFVILSDCVPVECDTRIGPVVETGRSEVWGLDAGSLSLRCRGEVQPRVRVTASHHRYNI